MTRALHGWLLLLPATVLLVAFTHYPAVATLVASFFSTPKGTRPAMWVGLDNYQALVADPVFWQTLRNNALFAVGTIPTRSMRRTRRRIRQKAKSSSGAWPAHCRKRSANASPP